MKPPNAFVTFIPQFFFHFICKHSITHSTLGALLCFVTLLTWMLWFALIPFFLRVIAALLAPRFLFSSTVLKWSSHMLTSLVGSSVLQATSVITASVGSKPCREVNSELQREVVSLVFLLIEEPALEWWSDHCKYLDNLWSGTGNKEHPATP